MSDSDKERFRCGACNSRICVCAITITGGITRAEVVERAAKGSPAAQAILATDRAPPKGTLEEAVEIFDICYALCHDAIEGIVPATAQGKYADELESLRTRRAALEPRLAKRRENQAKSRPTTSAVAPACHCAGPEYDPDKPCPMHPKWGRS